MCKFLVAVIAILTISLPVQAQQSAEVDRPSKLEASLYKASQFTNIAGAGLDEFTTGYSLTHPVVINYSSRSFNEVGWTKSVFGVDNPAGVVALNTARSIAVLWLSHKLYQKGGNWRKVGIGLNFIQGFDGLGSGLRNIQTRSRTREFLRGGS